MLGSCEERFQRNARGLTANPITDGTSFSSYDVQRCERGGEEAMDQMPAFLS